MEVVARSRRCRVVKLGRRGSTDRRRDARADTGSGGEVALGDELLVGVDGDTTAYPEASSERPRGGKRAARRQPSGSNRSAKLGLKLAPKRLRPPAIERDEQFKLGHWFYISWRIGPGKQDRPAPRYLPWNARGTRLPLSARESRAWSRRSRRPRRGGPAGCLRST